MVLGGLSLILGGGSVLFLQPMKTSNKFSFSYFCIQKDFRGKVPYYFGGWFPSTVCWSEGIGCGQVVNVEEKTKTL